MRKIAKYRELLLAEKERLTKQINNLLDDESVSFKDSVGNLSNYDNHPGDIGTELYEREKDMGLKHNNLEMLEKVEEALKAIDNNEYGYCKDCGEAISDDRLEVIPYTLKCSSCSEEDEEISKKRDQVKQPVGSNSADDLSDEKVEAWQEVEKYGSSSSELEHYNPDDFDD